MVDVAFSNREEAAELGLAIMRGEIDSHGLEALRSDWNPLRDGAPLAWLKRRAGDSADWPTRRLNPAAEQLTVGGARTPPIDPSAPPTVGRPTRADSVRLDPARIQPAEPLRGADVLCLLRFGSLRHHAAGAIGEVFRAEDVDLERTVALKALREGYRDDPESFHRFRQEAALTGRLEHPGIVPIHGIGRLPDGRPFYAMRFVEGESFSAAIGRWHEARQRGVTDDLGFRQMLQRFISLCQTVAFAHSGGVIHRDIKPGNVMLGSYGETLLVDWGLARGYRADPVSLGPGMEIELPRAENASEGALAESVDTMKTIEGMVLGTPAYMSPEQARGENDNLGPASDIASLGATLYHLLTGQPPYALSDSAGSLTSAARADRLPVRVRRPEVAPALAAICDKAMALEPRHRYDTAVELAEDVERYLADEPIRALPDRLADRWRRFIRRQRTALNVGLAALVVVLVILAGALFLGWRERQHLDRARDQAARSSSENRRLHDQAVERERIAKTAAELAFESYRDASGTIQELISAVEANTQLRRSGETRAIQRKMFEIGQRYFDRSLNRRVSEGVLRVHPVGARIQLAQLLMLDGKRAEAAKLLDEAEPHLAEIEREHPDEPQVVAARIEMLRLRTHLEISVGQWDQAEARLTRMEELHRKLHGDARSPHRVEQISRILNMLFATRLRTGDRAGALECLERVETLIPAEERETPSAPELADVQVRTLLNRVAYETATAGKDGDGVKVLIERALTRAEAALKRWPTEPGLLRAAAQAAIRLASWNLSRSKVDEAHKTLDRAMALVDARLRVDPDSPTQRLKVEFTMQRAFTWHVAGASRSCTQASREALDQVEPLIHRDPELLELRKLRADACKLLAYHAVVDRRYADAETYLEKGLADLRFHLGRDAKAADIRRNLREFLELKADMLDRLNRDASQVWKEALANAAPAEKRGVEISLMIAEAKRHPEPESVIARARAVVADTGTAKAERWRLARVILVAGARNGEAKPELEAEAARWVRESVMPDGGLPNGLALTLLRDDAFAPLRQRPDMLDLFDRANRSVPEKQRVKVSDAMKRAIPSAPVFVRPNEGPELRKNAAKSNEAKGASASEKSKEKREPANAAGKPKLPEAVPNPVSPASPAANRFGPLSGSRE
jgi:serine/threonine protein kinase